MPSKYQTRSRANSFANSQIEAGRNEERARRSQVYEMANAGLRDKCRELESAVRECSKTIDDLEVRLSEEKERSERYLKVIEKIGGMQCEKD